MAEYEIPLTPQPQTFSISLAGTSYQMTLLWNPVDSCWVLDIADSTGVGILSGIPLVTGVDLLEQFTYLTLGGSLYVITDNDLAAVPTFDNLGLQGHVLFVTP